MSKQAELYPCIRCNKVPDENDKYCTDCGVPLKNRCSDEPSLLKKGCTYLNAQHAAYCAKCGEPTMFQLHGLITPKYEHGSRPMLAKIHNWQQSFKNFT